MTSFRKLNKNDDMDIIANGIYFNERNLFDFLFNDKDKAMVAIKKLINSEYVNEYHGYFITVIYDEDPEQIEGFVISYGVNQIPKDSTFHAFKNTKQFSIPLVLLNRVVDNFKFLSNKDDYVIRQVYVLEEFRNKGHGSRLIKKSIQKARQNNAENVLLDVEYGNEYFLNFCKNLGFKEYNKRLNRLKRTVNGYKLKYELN